MAAFDMCNGPGGHQHLHGRGLHQALEFAHRGMVGLFTWSVEGHHLWVEGLWPVGDNAAVFGSLQCTNGPMD